MTTEETTTLGAVNSHMGFDGGEAHLHLEKSTGSASITQEPEFPRETEKKWPNP